VNTPLSKTAAAPVRCILSDCDGVIVDSEVIADAIMVEVLEEAFGVSGLGAQMSDMFGIRVIEIIRIMEGHGGA
jgi:beta-phosphoglucomutase-like phosphatase (HAD superfamily)